MNLAVVDIFFCIDSPDRIYFRIVGPDSYFEWIRNAFDFSCENRIKMKNGQWLSSTNIIEKDILQHMVMERVQLANA